MIGFDHGVCVSAAAEAYGRCCARIAAGGGSKVWKATVGYPGCMSSYVGDLLACDAQLVQQVIIDTGAWLADHPDVVIVGTVVVIAGVAFMLATGGSGAVVLVPVAL